jgi:hypothetical protein
MLFLLEKDFNTTSDHLHLIPTGERESSNPVGQGEGTSGMPTQ